MSKKGVVQTSREEKGLRRIKEKWLKFEFVEVGGIFRVWILALNVGMYHVTVVQVDR
ncbi:predicted protein [Sclerotinia sclerotiorum 1980 UF-70]|uniref:Uncharacterized protein n=1 Tax=Sclerotinia sclerotiorum (strain ATCC 18683 / 1980 / Ss-1) TaxID=665079 RepID=A7ENU0_SCLS1|nr:predicted protein [Sclerotinia sclerotiorum 1980 UF-70]EDO04506.1 predicted protein [Sclerotinia sclerotiorum 1980 UF-70]